MRISSDVRNICSSFGIRNFQRRRRQLDEAICRSQCRTQQMYRADNTFPANNSHLGRFAVRRGAHYEARPEVMKYASLGTLPAVYNTVRRGSVTEVKCECSNSWLSAESEANRRFSDTLSMTSPSSARKGLPNRQKITSLIDKRGQITLLLVEYTLENQCVMSSTEQTAGKSRNIRLLPTVCVESNTQDGIEIVGWATYWRTHASIFVVRER